MKYLSFNFKSQTPEIIVADVPNIISNKAKSEKKFAIKHPKLRPIRCLLLNKSKNKRASDILIWKKPIGLIISVRAT